MQDFALRRVSVQMNIVTSRSRLPGEELELLDFGRVTGVAKEVVACKFGLSRIGQRTLNGGMMMKAKLTSSAGTFLIGASRIDLVFGS